MINSKFLYLIKYLVNEIVADVIVQRQIRQRIETLKSFTIYLGYKPIMEMQMLKMAKCPF
jgi:hypothetical protein